MKQFAFTAQDLFCMAYLAQKSKMYGVPNVFGKNSQVQIQNTMDELMEKQIAVMDMDGSLKLSTDYLETMDFVCSCTQCVTVNLQHARKHISYIFWRRGNRYLMAEVINHKYILSVVDYTMVQTIFDMLTIHEKLCAQATETVVPQIALQKAQRSCANDQWDDAVRILRQHGAEEQIAMAIVEGLSGGARLVRILSITPTPEEWDKTEFTYLWSRGICIKMQQTVQNLRTCVVFTGVEAAAANQAIKDILTKFLRQ